MQDQQTPLQENENPHGAKKETITELAERHMRDEHHTTSDEELRNAIIDVGPTSDTEEIVNEELVETDNTTVIPPIPGEPDPTDEDDKGDNDVVPNPYKVLG